MNTKELECFLAVCEEKSIHKAADRMFISVQGMSRIIKKLESEVGAEILAPKASIPPSAKKKHWIPSITDIHIKAARGPNSAANRKPPQMWPEDPVPGIV